MSVSVVYFTLRFYFGGKDNHWLGLGQLFVEECIDLQVVITSHLRKRYVLVKILFMFLKYLKGGIMKMLKLITKTVIKLLMLNHFMLATITCNSIIKQYTILGYHIILE